MLSLILYVVALGLIYWVLTLLPLPDPFPVVLKVLFIILLIWVLLGAFGVATGPVRLR